MKTHTLWEASMIPIFTGEKTANEWYNGIEAQASG